MEHHEYFSAYEGILEGYIRGGEEHFLLQAFQLGRDMVEDGLSIELAVDMHFHVLEKLKNSVSTRYPDEERRWALPFLELTTAFGLACPNGLYGASKLLERLRTAISGRKSAEEELQKALEKHTAIIDNSMTGIHIIQDDKLQFVNNKFAEIYGYPKHELLGMKPDDLVYSEDTERIREIRSKILGAEAPEMEYEARGVKKNGEIIWVKRRNTRIEHEGRPAILGNIVDITRVKEVEAQLLQAQKMEAIGTLASGVAHDFNNILSGTLGYTEILLMDKKPADPEYETLKAIKSLTRKASNLAKSILAFGRHTDSRLRPCNLNSEVKAVRKLLSSTMGKSIEIDLELGKDPDTINADMTQILQILLNLCINARDAMSTSKGQCISIRTKNTLLHESFCWRSPKLKPGKYVQLCVTDTGCGMDEVTLSRIFNPFFTTKPVGKGTGLGLSMVYTLVMKHGGHITAHSKPQEGTTFNLYFPVIEETASSRASMAPEEVKNNKGTILFIDDDLFIREVNKKLLTKLGYDVITSGDGKEAVEIFSASFTSCRNAECARLPSPGAGPPAEPSEAAGAKATGGQGMRNEEQRKSAIQTNPKSLAQTGFGRRDLPASPVAPERTAIQNPQSKIDLVILDLIMPGMDGKTCLKMILEDDPEAKILITSGIGEEFKLDELVRMGAKGYLTKPYNVDELSQKIKEVMEAR